MQSITLPRHIDDSERHLSGKCRRATIIGANGAGKTRFMQEMINQCGERAFQISALSATFPGDSDIFIEKLYSSSLRKLPYMRSDAVTPIEKLVYMLFADEFEYLLSVKTKQLSSGKKIDLEPTRLDRLKRLWERIFPDNRIVRHDGKIMFSTSSGSDLIEVANLSQGEKTALYYIAAVLYAPENGVVFIDSPSLFLHPSIVKQLWDEIENLRKDCSFAYSSVDINFVDNTDIKNVCVWVKNYDAEKRAWDYDILTDDEATQQIFIDIAGSRKPVLFIEGDLAHSIDNRLYTTVFHEYTVRPLGSCDRVIQSTRTFNDLKYLHHLDSIGIVDRDRRTDQEVAYLNKKNILVPSVAEVENIFLMESVIVLMAKVRGKDAHHVVNNVRSSVINMFKSKIEEQTMQHVRHRIKRDVLSKIDAKFTCITALEMHIKSLVYKLQPRRIYNEIKRSFNEMVRTKDYAAILLVFNHKPMLSESNVAHLLGFKSTEDYIRAVVKLLDSNTHESDLMRIAIKNCLGVNDSVPSEAAIKENKANIKQHNDSESYFTLSVNHKRTGRKQKSNSKRHTK